MIGDVYGKTGRRMIEKILPGLRSTLKCDWVIANAENATGGTGVSSRHRNRMAECGVDLFTSGNHLFGRPDWPEVVSAGVPVLRPHNLGGDDSPGKGWAVLEKAGREPLGVINLAGRVFMEPASCPFRWAKTLIQRCGAGISIVLDFHAEATSEKIALAWHLDGLITFVAGTHTHVQTSDERILPGGTGAITDLGMTGAVNGVLGVDRETVLSRFLAGFSDRFSCAEGAGVLEGVLVETGPEGKTRTVSRIRVQEGDPPEESFSSSDDNAISK